MPEVQTVFVLLAAVAALAALARWIGVPYPVPMVLGGLALGFVPGLPSVELDPYLVLLLFVPPLVYQEALFASPRDLRANLRPILLLSLGLVAITTCAVAVVARAAIEGLPWGAAIVLGLVVSPTDAVAATAVTERLGVSRRIATVLGGEGLVNEAATVAFVRAGAATIAAGAFSLWEAAPGFVAGLLGGAAVGLAVGWALGRLLERLSDPVVENVVFLFFPFAAYLSADALGASGVVAVAVAGLYQGRRAPASVSGLARLQGEMFWEVAVFLLRALLFVLVGLQMPGIVGGLSGYSTASLVAYAAAVSLTVVAARLLWVFPATYLPRLLSRRLRMRDPYPGWRGVSVVAWGGMRGAVSLAAALSLPLTVEGGVPFPERDLILFLTFSVILATLVVQGLSLPALIRALGLEDDGAHEREEARGRVGAAEAALARLEELEDEGRVREDTAERMRAVYEYRRRRFVARSGVCGRDGDGREDYEGRSAAYRRVVGELIGAQRRALVRMRDEGEISDEALHAVERDLDLEEARIEE